MSSIMRTVFSRPVASLLIVLLTTISARNASAGMISTTQAIAQLSMSAQRERVAQFLERGEVQEQLTKLGVDPREAQARLHSLSDAEVQRIGTHLDQLPAGQDVLVYLVSTAVFIFIILLITDLLHLTKVFSFTR